MTSSPTTTRPLRRQRGVALVEFALVLPVFALLLVGILEFGLLMAYKNDATEAARDGARQAAVNAAGSNVACSTANNWLGAACQIAPSGSSICVRALDGNVEIGSRIRVTVDDVYRWATPLLATVTGSPSVTLHGENTMRIEQQGTNLPAGALAAPVCVQKP